MSQQQQARLDGDVQLVVYVFDTKVLETHVTFVHKLGGGRRDFGSFAAADHGTFVLSIASENITSPQQQYGKVVFIPLGVIDGRVELGGSSRVVLRAMRFAVEHKLVLYPSANAMALLCLAGTTEREEPWTLPSSWMRWLGSWRASAFDVALRLAHENNFATVVAAGNHHTSASCSAFQSPSLLMVGSLEPSGNASKRAPYSNFGQCVHLFAQGKAWGASAQSNESRQAMTGTSVSAAIVANRMAQLWQRNPKLSNTQLASEMLAWPNSQHQPDFDLACNGTQLASEQDYASCLRETTRRVMV